MHRSSFFRSRWLSRANKQAITPVDLCLLLGQMQPLPPNRLPSRPPHPLLRPLPPPCVHGIPHLQQQTPLNRPRHPLLKCPDLPPSLIPPRAPLRFQSLQGVPRCSHGREPHPLLPLPLANPPADLPGPLSCLHVAHLIRQMQGWQRTCPTATHTLGSGRRGCPTARAATAGLTAHRTKASGIAGRSTGGVRSTGHPARDTRASGRTGRCT